MNRKIHNHNRSGEGIPKIMKFENFYHVKSLTDLLNSLMKILKFARRTWLTDNANGINLSNFEGEASHLVEGILQTKALFSCCSFSYLKRDYNMVAHKLAQFAKSNLCSHVWKGVTPPFVSHLIVSNLELLAGGSLL